MASSVGIPSDGSTLSPTSAPTAAGPSNVLLISLKRTRFFYERATKELLASGVETVEVSALGDAIVTAVDLAASLEEKKTATILKIETKYQAPPFNQKGFSAAAPDRDTPPIHNTETKTPGIYIVLQKHPEFKGSRITPGRVTWCSKSVGPTPPFNEQPTNDVFASTVCGGQDFGFENEDLHELASLLQSDSCGRHNVSAYAEAHKHALLTAWRDRGASNGEQPVRLAEVTQADFAPLTDLKAIYCRPCADIFPDLDEQVFPGEGATGAVFIDVFDDGKAPFQVSKNSAMIYVVAPTGRDYSSKEEFLSAVRMTSGNLMTALCDFNGMVRRREKQTQGLKRFDNVRVCLFSGGAQRHSEASKSDVANAILAGLNEQFHYGTSPRLNFIYDEDVFKQAWVESTGLETNENSRDREEIPN